MSGSPDRLVRRPNYSILIVFSTPSLSISPGDDDVTASHLSPYWTFVAQRMADDAARLPASRYYGNFRSGCNWLRVAKLPEIVVE